MTTKETVDPRALLQGAAPERREGETESERIQRVYYGRHVLRAAAPQLALTCISQEERIAELEGALRGLVKAVNTNELAAVMACHALVAFANVDDALKIAIPALTNTGEGK
ncbi:MAG: hypothetical protein V4696_01630 [Pseudomonadota bacterium]